MGEPTTEIKPYSNLVIPNNLTSNTSTVENSSTYVGATTQAVADSGTTGHFITEDTPCVNVQKTYNPIPIKMPNGDIISSTHIALLPQQNLPLPARKAHIFPKLTKPLISIGILCDNGCIAVFDADQVTIYNKTTKLPVMMGKRDPVTTLYMVNMTATPSVSSPPSFPTNLYANHVYETQSKQDLILFYHAACFSPSKSTFIKAIKNKAFTTWPGLTAELVAKYLPKTEATVKGHMKQTFKGTNSTQPTTPPSEPPPEIITQRTHQVFMKVTEFSNKIYTDQTGRFPVTSSRGYKYIMIAYEYDSNNILAESLKSRTGLNIKNAYQKIRQLLISRGLTPQIHVLDNECSQILKDYMQGENEEFQLVPPHLHRRNAAERAIQTWKNHFISGIVSTHNKFPLHLWCRLLPQAILTLNLLRQSRINPTLSAQAQLHGQFDYNATPIAPPGTKVITHNKPTVRTSWEPRGSDGWYVDRAKDHYRCYDIYMPKTRTVIQSDTVEFFPHNSKMPFRSSTENVTVAATELINALKNPAPAAPFAHIGDKQMEALDQLANIFKQVTIQPIPVHEHPAARPRVGRIPQSALKNHPSVVPRVALGPQSVKLPQSATTSHPMPVPRVALIPQSAVPRDASVPRVETRQRASFDPLSTTMSNVQLTTEPPQTTAPMPHLIPPDTDTSSPGTFNSHVSPSKECTRRLQQHERRSQYESCQKQESTISPSVIPPGTHRYPFRHKRQPQPTLLRKKYALAAAFIGHNEANSVTHPITGDLQEFRHLIVGPDREIWLRSLANEFGRLAQGVGNRIEGTNTIHFILKSEVPFGTNKVTFPRIVCDIRPSKSETHRTRITVCGNLLPFAGILTTPTATVTTAKCLFNSVISTPGAKCMTADVKKIYLNNDLPDPEYMKFLLSNIPQEIIDEYNLLNKVDAQGYVYIKIVKGMYGLKQAGIIAHNELIKHLAPYGYAPVQHTPGLWKHETRDTIFSLVVDDFAIKYISTENIHHLLNALKSKYTISEDWTAQLYIGITLKWDYIHRTVDLSMPNYVKAALLRFKHTLLKRRDAPHKHVPPTYGTKVQYAPPDDDLPQLPADRINYIQQVVGVFLYYGIAIDNTILVALGDIGAEQSRATATTNAKVDYLLDYMASNPIATIRYHASGMVLFIHSDASYLSVSKARSRASGVFFLSNPKPANVQFSDYTPILNGFVHVLCKILRNVMSSTAEAEYGALFLNGQAAVPIRTTLIEMGHPQPPTPIQVDNSTAVGIANKSIKQKMSKAMDMRFHWIQDRTAQSQFRVFWKPGSTNLGDYHSKHHPEAHHLQVRDTNLYEPSSS